MRGYQALDESGRARVKVNEAWWASLPVRSTDPLDHAG